MSLNKKYFLIQRMIYYQVMPPWKKNHLYCTNHDSHIGGQVCACDILFSIVTYTSVTGYQSNTKRQTVISFTSMGILELPIDLTCMASL